MKALDYEPQEPSFQPVESLLRDAAEYEPEEAAPADFAARALARLQEPAREEPRRQRPAQRVALLTLLFGGGAAAAGALCATLSPAMDRMTPAPAPGGQIARAPEREPAQVTTRIKEQPRKPAAPITEKLSPRRRRVVLAQRRTRTRPPREARPPRARWEVEVVETEIARTLTPGWLVEADEAGEPVLVPGVLEQVKPVGPAACAPQTEAAASPATTTPTMPMTATNEETEE